MIKNNNVNDSIDNKICRNQLIREKLGIEKNKNTPLLYFSIPFELKNDFLADLGIDKDTIIMSLNGNKSGAIDLTKITISESIDLLLKILKESYSQNPSKLVLMDSTKITFVPPLQDNYQEPIHEFGVYQGNYKYILPEIRDSLEKKESIKNINDTIYDTNKQVNGIL